MKRSLLFIAALSFASAAGAQSATYKVEPTHTFVNFETLHFGTSTSRGRWTKKDGEITLDRAAKTGTAKIVIDMASIDTGVPALDKHLRSPDFFDAENHPNATFTGNTFKFDGDKLSEVVGELSMRGKSNPLALKAVRFNCYQSPILKREVCGGDFETTIKRSLWDVNYGVANKALADDIRVLITVEAVKAD